MGSLEEQLLVPLLGDDPIVEMGVGGHEDEVLARLRSQAPYPDLFSDAFPEDDDPVTIERIAMAIAAFERTVNTGASPFDQHLLGDDGAMTDAAKRGAERFDALGCGQCHGGLFFDRPLEDDGTVAGASGYFNTGLYDVDGMGGYPPNDQGLVMVTGDPADTGRFRTPSLRNVAATAPYMHDGTTPTLSDVLNDYARGGRLVVSGAYPGDGAGNRYKDPRLTGFPLSDGDRDDLLAFFDALTDWASLEDPRFEDPWCADDDPRDDCVPPIAL
jgi:cytochrome c peroxidase